MKVQAIDRGASKLRRSDCWRDAAVQKKQRNEIGSVMCGRAICKLALIPRIACAVIFFVSLNITEEAHSRPDPSSVSEARTDKSSDYSRYWPQGRPALAKLTDKLILAIPPQYQKFWIQQDYVIRAPAKPDHIPLAPVVGFSFFLPDFSGYTPNNYENDFDEDRVDVVSLEPADPKQAEPGAPGFYPPNTIKRLIAVGTKGEPQDLYGLKCYRSIGDFQNKLWCYGRADDRISEDILLYVYVPPFDRYTAFPIMQATYFTKRHGGLQITWNTHSNNFSRWHDIDAQIWKFIDAWNIAGPAGSKTKK
jgi:hypothetical protein